MMKRVMTGVRLELTTYGLKERRVTTTGENAPSDSGALRGRAGARNTPETRPNGGAVRDEMCRASTHCCGAFDRDWCGCLEVAA